jgi:hypothetical protein
MFVKAIANVTKQSIVDKLKQQTQFFSITIDGSTDSTGEDLESIYVRTCQNGTADDLFLHIGDAESVCSTDTPLFSNFLFTNLFSIKFLYFFIISSFFPYFNLFVSIFIQSSC